MRKKTNEEFIKQVEELVGNEYNFLEPYKKALESISVKHEKCGNVYSVQPANFLNGQRCPKCRLKSRTKTHNQFVSDVKEMYGDEYIVKGEYRKTHSKLDILHNECGEVISIAPSDLLSGHGCSYCAGNKQRTNHEFVKDMEKEHGHIELKTKYQSVNSPIKYVCNKCGATNKTTPKMLYKGHVCCSNITSFGEEEVKQFLLESNVTFSQQKRFDDCRNKYTLPFDFATYTDNGKLYALIEYDGIQHFRYREDSVISGKESYLRTRKTDKIKNKYCEENNIKLIRIPYFKKNKINNILTTQLKEIIPSQAI